MTRKPSALKAALRGILALILAACVWMPLVHLFFKPDLDNYLSDTGISTKAASLAATHLELWSTPELSAAEIDRMRRSNAEWDFMARTFFVLSLANMSLRNPENAQQYLAIMDTIIDETIQLEQAHGIYYFLMDYAREGSFVAKPGRSLFQDGEIALMLAARRLVQEKPAYRPLVTERVNAMVEYMQESPVLSGESYPDECWTFCNSVALAAIRIADVLDGSDHSTFLRQWIDKASRELVDEETGLLISSYSFHGAPYDGPEGSSIWMVCHCLEIVDGAFARDQYRRARKHLGRSLVGFGYAREWPSSWRGPMDIDSGPIIPFLQISPGSSGLAIMGASAFGDRAFLSALLTSLNFGGFPSEKNGQLRYCASNQVGDSVILYALVLGPLWDEVDRAAGQKGKRVDDDGDENG